MAVQERRYELDWLRVLAIFVVLLYHSSRYFILGDWHVKNADTYVWVELWNIFATQWMMPLFFIISGASLFYTIRKSTGWRKFFADKYLRRMIPLIIGSVTLAALLIYLEKSTHGQFSGSFFSFLPEYFSGLYLAINMPGNLEVLHRQHTNPENLMEPTVNSHNIIICHTKSFINSALLWHIAK